jgi:hypothetical protein
VFVRDRAQGRCEYCHKPDEFVYISYHVDHIIAIRHEGSDEPHNLAWSCATCNISKGTNVATYDRVTNLLVPFYNLRTQKWDDHFEIQNNLILGKTPIGRATTDFFNMNTPEQIFIRQFLIGSGNW